MAFGLSLLLVAGTLLLLIRAGVVCEDDAGDEPMTLRQLVDEKERCVRVLRDLELDAQLGNLGTEEYAELRARVEGEMAHILHRIDILSAQHRGGVDTHG